MRFTCGAKIQHLITGLSFSQRSYVNPSEKSLIYAELCRVAHRFQVIP